MFILWKVWILLIFELLNRLCHTYSIFRLFFLLFLILFSSLFFIILLYFLVFVCDGLFLIGCIFVIFVSVYIEIRYDMYRYTIAVLANKLLFCSFFGFSFKIHVWTFQRVSILNGSFAHRFIYFCIQYQTGYDDF